MTAAGQIAVAHAIHAAEEVGDVLEGLVERAIIDPGAAFEPEVIVRLTELKNEDRAGYEILRAKLKKDGHVRVTALDDLVAAQAGDEGPGRGPSQADRLVELAAEAELFHTPEQTGYADIMVDGHRETWRIRSKSFRQWLTRQYYLVVGGAPNSEALQSALGVIEAKAHFGSPEREVRVRVASMEGLLYIDLADEAWRAIEISKGGWRIIDSPPVRFRRSAGMQPLPTPERGSSIYALRPFLNVQTEADFVLAVSWLLAAMRDEGPYPALALSGEQGSAKSTFCAILRSLLDPNSAPLRALPREDRELFIAANNGHVLAFDNVSGLPTWISDTLCRLATGGGFAVRQLHTDQDEVLFAASRPVILNGIEDIVTRPDLADRSLFLILESIPDSARRPQQELWSAFEQERPRIIGALLDAVAHGLQALPTINLASKPRMADFAVWASACETALWPQGTFWAAYSGNRDDLIANVIDADPVASAVRALMTNRTRWTGTAADLLGALSEEAADAVRRSKAWPTAPKVLSGRIRRAATFLRSLGIRVEFTKSGHRHVTILKEPDGSGSDAPTAPSASNPTSNSHDANGLRAGQDWAQAGAADAPVRPAQGHVEACVRTSSTEINDLDAADAADATRTPQSGRPRTAPWSVRL